MAIPYAEVIGDPIAHSKSPRIHAFWLQSLGLTGDYRATRVPTEVLPKYLTSRRQDPEWRGCNVTIPHKISVMEHLDRIDSAEVGAVNCIVPDGDSLRGLNTDVLGIDDALEGRDTNGPVVLIGAGGAARAALAWMKAKDVEDMRVIARDPSKAQALLADFGCRGQVFGFDEAGEALAGAAGLLNGTPLGMNGFDPMPPALLGALDSVRPGGFVLDMVYSPVETEMLRRAAKANLEAIDGLAMLIGQARSAFHLFFGASPPAECDAELRTILTS
jgi:shikimate dehydrogenase